MAKHLFRLAALAAMTAPVAASACSITITREPTFMENKAWAKKTLAAATLVIDGEVIEPQTDTTPAKIKVARWFKGPESDFIYSKGDSGLCEDELRTKGERLRLLLFGEAGAHHSYSSISSAPADRAIDRLLGSDRRKDWPYFNPDAPGR